MTITLPLQPQEEARLMAVAPARGLSADALIREALEGILAGPPAETSAGKEPTRSLRGILAKYGPAPSAGEIDLSRAEMFANFPRSLISDDCCRRRHSCRHLVSLVAATCCCCRLLARNESF